MKINAFFPNPPNGESYTSILQRDIAKEEGEFYLVCAEYQRPGTNDSLADFKGLDIALTLDPEVHPIIFCSFMPESYFLKDEYCNRFHALMAKKRTCFMRLPFTPEELVVKYKELLGDNKEVDTLAIEINRVETFENEMGRILHSAQSHFNNDSSYAKERIAQAVSEAKKIGATGTDEEIALQIKNFKRQPKNSMFVGKYFPGIFCDIEGTLIVDGKVNISMLSTLQDRALSKPITLWTGGDTKEIQKILLENNITWKLVSKTDFAGAEVEIAYDDEEFWVFAKNYGIKVREFIQL